jgi:hypothetical protein
MGHGIEIYSKVSPARISVGAYGDEQTKEILKIIIEVNPRIDLDERARKLLVT